MIRAMHPIHGFTHVESEQELKQIALHGWARAPEPVPLAEAKQEVKRKAGRPRKAA